jgi:hypothetical protein
MTETVFAANIRVSRKVFKSEELDAVDIQSTVIVNAS